MSTVLLLWALCGLALLYVLWPVVHRPAGSALDELQAPPRERERDEGRGDA